jgi:polyadenylate-binding protein
VSFENPDYASKARKDLNGEIFSPAKTMKGRPIRVCKYHSKNQINEDHNDPEKSLLVKGVDESITAKEFFKIFEEYGEVKSSKLEVDENGHSKGYGYILYNDAKAAQLAKNKLVRFFNSE